MERRDEPAPEPGPEPRPQSQDEGESDDEFEFAFDLDSEDPLDVAPLVDPPFCPQDDNGPMVREDPELEWVERWRKQNKKRKHG